MAFAGRAKAMMAERLAASEAKLLKMSRDDVVQTLVETKMTLAQSEFQALSLQVGADGCPGIADSRHILPLPGTSIKCDCCTPHMALRLLKFQRQHLYRNGSRKLPV